jgi:SAM-dependent methyltransferase
VSPLNLGASPTDAGRLQSRLWGNDPHGWELFGEPHNLALFVAVLNAADVRTGSRLLDVGCGTGLTLQLGRERGATIAGVDVTLGLLEVATNRLPHADLWCADMVELPFADNSFDAVVGVNAFQFAGDPRRALVEAARVCAPGGYVAASMFAEPERSESTAVHLAMAALSPPQRQGDHAPYALSAPGNLEAALVAAGLVIDDAGEVEVTWRYQSVADAVRGLLSSGGASRAVEDVGLPAVRATIKASVQPFTDAAGEVRMRNVFRWVAARKL